jgi:hypothetical protein
MSAMADPVAANSAMAAADTKRCLFIVSLLRCVARQPVRQSPDAIRFPRISQRVMKICEGQENNFAICALQYVRIFLQSSDICAKGRKTKPHKERIWSRFTHA